MEEIKKGDNDYRTEFKKKYSKAIHRCHQLLGQSGFEKDPSTNSRTRSKNSTLFEVWMVTLAKMDDSTFKKLLNKQAVFLKKSSALLQDPEFFNAITYSTQKKDHVIMRYEKVNNLISEVLND
jgi:hypothetical protein